MGRRSPWYAKIIIEKQRRRGEREGREREERGKREGRERGEREEELTIIYRKQQKRSDGHMELTPREGGARDLHKECQEISGLQQASLQPPSLSVQVSLLSSPRLSPLPFPPPSLSSLSRLNVPTGSLQTSIVRVKVPTLVQNWYLKYIYIYIFNY